MCYTEFPSVSGSSSAFRFEVGVAFRRVARVVSGEFLGSPSSLTFRKQRSRSCGSRYL